MQRLSRRDHNVPKPLIQRLDRIFADINAVLLALAIGLAVLDLTCYAAMKYIDLIEHLPPGPSAGVAADQAPQPPVVTTGYAGGL